MCVSKDSPFRSGERFFLKNDFEHLCLCKAWPCIELFIPLPPRILLSELEAVQFSFTPRIKISALTW